MPRAAACPDAAPPPDAARARQRGFALLVVLWALVFVSLLILRLTEAGTAEARLGGNLRRAAVAGAEADGAFEQAAFLLATGRARPGVLVLGTPHGRAAVTLASEAGKVDLNNGSAPILAALLATVGVPPERAGTLVAAIVAWRTSVPLAQLPALMAPYRAAGRALGPPGTPFRSVGELRLVLGITPALFARLAPHLTVHGTGDPDLAAADPVVREAAASIGETPATNPPSGGGLAAAGSAWSIAVRERTDAGARFARDGIVELGAPADGRPWRVVRWRQPDTD